MGRIRPTKGPSPRPPAGLREGSRKGRPGGPGRFLWQVGVPRFFWWRICRPMIRPGERGDGRTLAMTTHCRTPWTPRRGGREKNPCMKGFQGPRRKATGRPCRGRPGPRHEVRSVSRRRGCRRGRRPRGSAIQDLAAIFQGLWRRAAFSSSFPRFSAGCVGGFRHLAPKPGLYHDGGHASCHWAGGGDRRRALRYVGKMFFLREC